MAPRDFASFGDEPDFREAIAAILAQQSAQPSRGVAGGLTNFATGFGSGLLGAQVRGDRRAEDQEARAITAAILRGENPNLDGLSGRNFGRLAPIVLDQQQRRQRAQQEAAERAQEQAFRQQTRAEDRQFRLEDRDYERSRDERQFQQQLALQRLREGRPNEFLQRAAAAQQFGVDPNSEEGRRFILSGNLGGGEEPLAQVVQGDRVVYVPRSQAIGQEAPRGSDSAQSEIGRINADLAAGRITEEQAQQGLNAVAQRGVTDAQRTVSGFANRLNTALPIIDSLEAYASNPSSGAALQLVNLPILGNLLASENAQQLDQAARDFINATLRRESGSAIQEEEFQNARTQYLPTAGDTEATLRQKRANRYNVRDSFIQQSGSAYQGPLPSAPAPAKAAPTAAPAGQGAGQRVRFNLETGDFQ